MSYDLLMSKKYILLSVLILAFLLLPLSVFADDTVSSSSSTIRSQLLQTREMLKSKILQERNLFKEKVAALKDQRKKTIVERVDERIPEINSNRTTQMSNALARMNDILDRISTKAAALKAQGKNTTALDQAITTARNAITTSQTAVNTQAGKTYTISITTEDTLKTTVGATLKQLTTDLQATHKTVIAAREAVRKAITELAKLGGVRAEGSTKTATEAAQ